MLLQHKPTEHYAKAIYKDGTFYRFYSHKTKEEALLEKGLSGTCTKEALDNSSWNPLPLTLDTLTMHDRVEDEDGEVRTMLSADGFGGQRVYGLSTHNKEDCYGLTYTAHVLQEHGFTPVQPDFITQEEVVEMSGRDECARSG